MSRAGANDGGKESGATIAPAAFGPVAYVWLIFFRAGQRFIFRAIEDGPE
jgi:hypothetical protein